jgi:hypothetical protein
MVWLVLAILAYVLDTYVQGWEGTRWWFVVGSLVYGVGVMSFKVFKVWKDPKYEYHGLDDIPFWIIALSFSSIVANVFFFTWLAPTLIVWNVMYMIFIVITTCYIMGKKL